MTKGKPTVLVLRSLLDPVGALVSCGAKAEAKAVMMCNVRCACMRQKDTGTVQRSRLKRHEANEDGRRARHKSISRRRRGATDMTETLHYFSCHAMLHRTALHYCECACMGWAAKQVNGRMEDEQHVCNKAIDLCMDRRPSGSNPASLSRRLNPCQTSPISAYSTCPAVQKPRYVLPQSGLYC